MHRTAKFNVAAVGGLPALPGNALVRSERCRASDATCRVTLSTVLERYAALAAQSGWSFDPAQAEVARRFDALTNDLADTVEQPSAWARLFGLRSRPEAPKGLYIHGAVGRGKTMLMDTFFAIAPVERKRRAHFHAFMTDVHARIHAWRQAKKRHAVEGDDPIAPVARDLAAAASLLCFDEFAITDIADAMILGRLFAALFAAGVTIVATSNVAPADLYRDGLNRALFLPSIALIEAHMDVIRLDAAQDYRLTKLSRAGTWFVPADAAANAVLDGVFTTLTGQSGGSATALPLLGRTVAIPQAASGVARFGFRDLCEAPLGAADFLAIAQNFHTVIIDDIRVMAPAERNVVKRFIVLVDTLYDSQVKLIASAAAEPDALYSAADGHEVFEFQRTVSRLIEMRSDAYLALPHRAASGSRAGDTGGLVET